MTVKAAPGVKITDVLPEAEPLVAVMKAVPASVELIDDVARPLVVRRGVSTLPRLVTNDTLLPSGTALPN